MNDNEGKTKMGNIIEVKGLKKNFGSLEVLKGINETIRENEVVCIIGPSGSGKSTFLRCLNYLEVPTEGEIIVDGTVLSPQTENTIRTEQERSKPLILFWIPSGWLCARRKERSLQSCGSTATKGFNTLHRGILT